MKKDNPVQEKKLVGYNCAVCHGKNVSESGNMILHTCEGVLIPVYESVQSPHTKKTCDCKELSCKKDCNSGHTHKGFFCNICEPEACKKMSEPEVKSAPMNQGYLGEFAGYEKNTSPLILKGKSDTHTESVNFMQASDSHCLTCHIDVEADFTKHLKEAHNFKTNPTDCTEACGKWFKSDPTLEESPEIEEMIETLARDFTRVSYRGTTLIKSNVKGQLRALLLSERLRIEREVEGMRKYTGDHRILYMREYAYNSALDSVLSLLRDKKK